MAELTLTEEEEQTLQRWARRAKSSQALPFEHVEKIGGLPVDAEQCHRLATAVDWVRLMPVGGGGFDSGVRWLPQP